MKKKHTLIAQYSLALSLSALSLLAGTTQAAWADETAAQPETEAVEAAAHEAAEVQAASEAPVVQAALPEAPEEVVATFSPTETDSLADAAQGAQFAPEANPAIHTHFGWGRFRLPPSFKLDVGSNIPITKAIGDFQNFQKAFSPLSKALSSGQLSEQDNKTFNDGLDSILKTLGTSARLDYDLDVGLIGFMGNPVGALQIGGRNLTLGLNVGGGGKGYFAVNVSPQTADSLRKLGKESLPSVISLSGQIQGLSSQANTLTNSATAAAGLATSLTGIATNPPTTTAGIESTVTQLDNAIKSLNDLVKPAQDLSTSATAALNTGDQVIQTANTITQGGLSVDAVVDGHLTFGLSGSYPVFENDVVRVGVGTNLKLFVLPFNPSVQSLTGVSGADTTLMGRLQITGITGTNAFNSVSNIINKDLRPVSTSMNTLVTDANTLIADLTTARNRLDTNKANPITALTDPQFLDASQKIANSATTITGGITTITNDVTKAFNSAAQIQSVFLQDLGNIKVAGLAVNPSSAGFGVDVGVDAVFNNSLWLGLLLQNPLVLWPATEKPFTVGADGKFTVDNVNKKSVNYGLSEPFAAMLSARYSFDQLLPHKGLSAWGEFELVTNGRMPGLTVGAQQQLGPAYLGLGGRVGGVASLIFAQAGLRTAGPFGLDFTAGISPTLSGGLANLGLYLQF